MILTLIMLLSMYSCSDNEFPQNIAFTTISNGVLSGIGKEEIPESNMVINNTNDWQDLITKMNSHSVFNNVSDNFSETVIDFDNYLILTVFLEVKGYGWEVEIVKITESKNKLVVSVEETIYINAAITQPFSIVKIPKTDKPIEFE